MRSLFQIPSSLVVRKPKQNIRGGEPFASRRLRRLHLAGSCIAFALAGCGGGGGGPAGPGGGINPPVSSPTPGATGQMQIATSAGGYANFGLQPVAFSCGCSSQAGSATTDASGNYSIPLSSTAIPQGSGTYAIVAGRNYVIIAGAPTAAQSWTMTFIGSQPSHNVALNASSDIYTAAATLYVYNFSENTNLATAFDSWNINTVRVWMNTLESAPTSSEQKLLTDIKLAQMNQLSLYPSAPGWQPSAQRNHAIAVDLAGVQNDPKSTHPTPCPSGVCAGAPSP